MNRNLFSWLLALFIGGTALNLSAQGTSFLYQGRLNDGSSPATGKYDFAFALYDASTNGNAVGSLQTSLFVPVTNGLFTTNIDFGNVFTGTNYWLAIAVRASGTTNVSTNVFTPLWPRQPLSPVPYAIFATGASNLLGALPAAQLSGTLPSSLLSGTYSGAVSFPNSGNTIAGNGSGLTTLNGSQVTSGTVADARLSANVALLNASQTYTGNNQFYGSNNFTNFNNSFSGSFFGNGLVGWVAVTGTTQQAVRDHGYMLTSPALTTVTLPANANLISGDIVRVSGAGAGGWLVQENSGQSIIGTFASYTNNILLPTSANEDWHGLAGSIDGSRMYAAGNFSGGVSVSTDFGKTWVPAGVNGSGWFGVACSANGSTVYAAASGAAIQYSYNGGATWGAGGTPTPAWSCIACSADGSKVYAGTKGGGLYQSSSASYVIGGNVSTIWTSVAVSSDGSHVAAAANGALQLVLNGGVTTPTSPGVSCTAVAISADGLKLVVAGSSGIATSTNFGTSWTTTTAPVANWDSLAVSSDCTRIVAGASNGVLRASSNFGKTWTALSTTNQYWSAAVVTSDGTKFAAATSTVGSAVGSIFNSSTITQLNTSTNSNICGSQGSAVELQYIGNGQFIPVSSSGLLWAN